jgi:hypothetical protein
MRPQIEAAVGIQLQIALPALKARGIIIDDASFLFVAPLVLKFKWAHRLFVDPFHSGVIKRLKA